MFIDVATHFPQILALEKHFETIREEALKVPLEKYAEWNDPNAYAGGWRLFLIYCFEGWDYAKYQDDNRLLCPKTWELTKDIPDKVLVGLSYLQPGTHVFPHYDKVVETMGYANSARFHMGISVPKGYSPVRVGEAMGEYQEGSFIGFDGGLYEHEVANNSDKGRLSFCVELMYDPAKLGAPASTAAE